MDNEKQHTDTIGHTSKCYLDCESAGLAGMPVLLQFAIGEGEIQLHDIWKVPIQDTLDLLKFLYSHTIVGFNLVFDSFMIAKLATTWTLVLRKLGNIIPEEHIYEIAILEEQARFINLCIKPKGALDLMLHSRKTEFQKLMERDEIRIRRVPTALALALKQELDKRLELEDIFFAKKKEADKWHVLDTDYPEFKDLELRFAPSGALKSLAKYVLGKDKILKFHNVALSSEHFPNEIKYAPFALSVATKDSEGNVISWNGAWPDKIKKHIDHWATNKDARTYGTDDIIYTRELDHYFGDPEPDDDDSVLACMVGAVRWRGFDVDLCKLQALRKKCQEEIHKISQEIDYASPLKVRSYLEEVLSETEKIILLDKKSGKITTKAVVLEEIAKWDIKDKNGNVIGWHKAALRAQLILKARQDKKEIELYDKILLAGRFHPSFNVLGALSYRMSGADDLNPQGIKKEPYVRECFTFCGSDDRVEHGDDYINSGGDFDAFEVTIAEAAYKDPQLREDMLAGKKLHGIFGEALFPDLGYEGVLASKGLEGDADKYDISKRGVFAIIYGGDESTLASRLGVALEMAEKAYSMLITKYKQIGVERAKIFDMFCSMRQPGGIGSQVVWHEPNDYIENLFGFKRYFTLENYVCKTLFEIAQKPPSDWRQIKIKVVRKSDRGEQTGFGATLSSLYACAFAIQAQNMRAAANHVIQSTGAKICKHTERCIWDIQPSGLNIWLVVPMNIHDEIPTVTHKSVTELVRQKVVDTVNSFRTTVPLIKMDWKSGMKSWADK